MGQSDSNAVPGVCVSLPAGVRVSPLRWLRVLLQQMNTRGLADTISSPLLQAFSCMTDVSVADLLEAHMRRYISPYMQSQGDTVLSELRAVQHQSCHIEVRPCNRVFCRTLGSNLGCSTHMVCWTRGSTHMSEGGR